MNKNIEITYEPPLYFRDQKCLISASLTLIPRSAYSHASYHRTES